MIGKTNALIGGGGSGPTPTGTISISANGIYDVGSYASASVNVPQISNEPTARDLCTGAISYYNGNFKQDEVRPWLFSGCYDLSYVIDASEGTNRIRDGAFYACWNMSYFNMLSKGIIYNVGNAAFQQCTALSMPLIFNSSLNISIYSSAFYQCSGITEARIYTSYIGNQTISDYAFYGCTSLSSIYLSCSYVVFGSFAFGNTAISFVDTEVNFNPRNVNEGATYTFPGYCFQSCSKLEYVRVVQSQYASIGQYCFAFCSMLSSVYLENVKAVGAYAFRGCSSLAAVTASQLTSINASAFTLCGILSADYPTVYSVQGSAFWRCGSLKYVRLSNSLSMLASSVFYSCSALKYVYAPNVSRISSAAFYSCDVLTSFMLTTSMAFSFTGSSNFLACKSLESFYLFTTGTIGMASVGCFNTTPLSNSTYLGRYGSIYVRQSMLATYKATTNWVMYSDRMVGLTDEEVEQIIAAYGSVTYSDVA